MEREAHALAVMPLANVTPGMRLLKDIKVGNTVVVRRDYLLTQTIIEKLKSFCVEKIDVFEPSSLPTVLNELPGLETRNVPTHGIICREGDGSREIFFLKSGRLGFFHLPSSGTLDGKFIFERGRMIGTVSEPDTVFGEVGALLKQPRSATVIAIEDSVVQWVPARSEHLEAAIRERPEFGLKLALELARRITETNGLLKAVTELFNRVDAIRRDLAARYTGIVNKIETRFRDNPRSWALSGLYEWARAVPLYAPRGIVRPTPPPPPEQRGLEARSVAFDGLSHVVSDIPEGYELCREGEPGDSMFLLLNGRLGVFVQGKRIATITRAGSMIGEISLLMAHVTKTPMEPRTATIRALVDSQMVTVQVESLPQALLANPNILIHVVQTLCQRLPETSRAYSSVSEEVKQELKRLSQAEYFETLFQKMRETGESVYFQDEIADGQALLRAIPEEKSELSRSLAAFG